MARGKAWDKAEDAVLMRLYPRHGWRACNAELPHRSKGAITYRATAILRLSYRYCGSAEAPRPESNNPIPVPPDTRDAWARLMGDPIPARSALHKREIA